MGFPAILVQFFHRFDLEALDRLQTANQTLLDRVHRERQAGAINMDLDSSHADTYTQQEKAAYNARYQTIELHPLVAFDRLTGDLLKAKLRLGNVYTSNGVVDFIRPVNLARMTVSLLTYNLTNWLLTLSFPAASKGI
ncbi:hypothetical protein CSV80_15150 [Sporosarcina sp. P12(2017)]|nr:hypothetical protein CSV81_15995 [Sporosarcina sp. P10]PIC59609.1 hypothetical protein CSV80_15150 [Sporosarcina sp. P12(2017)]